MICRVVGAQYNAGEYFITGDLTPEIFADDCVFRDPTNETKGLSRYVKVSWVGTHHALSHARRAGAVYCMAASGPSVLLSSQPFVVDPLSCRRWACCSTPPSQRCSWWTSRSRAPARLRRSGAWAATCASPVSPF